MAEQQMQEPAPKARRARNDNRNGQRPAASRKSPSGERNLFTDMVMGLRFYSRFPVPGPAHEKPSMNRMVPALGITSLIIMLVPAAILLFLSPFRLPDLVVASIAICAWVVVTGAMAEDALADSADGLFGGATIAKRLEILHDSRHGTYGVTTLVLFLLIRAGVLAGLLAVSPLAAAGVWAASTILSRSAAPWLAMQLPPARNSGSGASAGRTDRLPFWSGMVIAGLLAFICAAPFAGIAGLVAAIIVGVLVCLGWTWVCRRLAGGYTGDLIGALQALVEIATLIVFLSWVS